MEHLSVAAAQQCVLEAVAAFGAEQVKLEQSLGRVLAEEVRANRDQPPYDISAMDGYALRSADLAIYPPRWKSSKTSRQVTCRARRWRPASARAS